MTNFIKRFLYAFKCFKYAWRDYHPKRSWYGTYEHWILEDKSFRIETFDSMRRRSKGVSSIFYNPEDYSLLSKRCIDKDGRVRYFPVVPKGYDLAVKHLDGEEKK
jgi:hypothetical protein